MQTIVIGHKNPDMDSICSALAYAHLKRETGNPNVVAGRAGSTNARIDFVLDKFGVESPEFFSDLSPRVGDVMQRDVISVPQEKSLYDSLALMEKERLRALPVLDGEGRFLGLLSYYKISHYLFPPREESGRAREVHASLASMVRTFQGHSLTGELCAQRSSLKLMVGAMGQDAFNERLQSYEAGSLVVFVGDRTNIQWKAIKHGVLAIVVTGGLAPDKDMIDDAARAGVSVVSSPFDTASTVLLARGAVDAGLMVDTEFTAFDPETSLAEAREKVRDTDAAVFPILDTAGGLVGVLSKSDFIKPVPRQLILVDHNELSQAVKGAGKVPIVEILDHHRLGGFHSSTPILFWNNPVGSTSTIVALAYGQAGVQIPRPMAGLLMAGLLTDTLNLTSPTTTDTDRQMMQKLSQITGEDPAALAKEIFSVGSPLLTMPAEGAITADCKEYEEHGHRFSVAQIEELSFSHLAEKQEALLAALNAYARENHYLFSTLLVTDINTRTSLLLASGDEVFLKTIDHPTAGPQTWRLGGVVSRKKQLLPYLLTCLERMPE
jgi:manganese-dependent inorganic pyrophosphatase